MTGPKGAETHNRQSQVLLRPHPDCEACESYASKLNEQIVANGRLRLELYDLRRELNRLKHGRDYGLPDRNPADPSLGPADHTCTHGVPLSEPCSACGIVEE